MTELKVGDRIALALAPEIKGEVVEVLEVPGDDLYMILLDGHAEPVRYSRAVLIPA